MQPYLHRSKLRPGLLKPLHSRGSPRSRCPEWRTQDPEFVHLRCYRDYPDLCSHLGTWGLNPNQPRISSVPMYGLRHGAKGIDVPTLWQSCLHPLSYLPHHPSVHCLSDSQLGCQCVSVSMCVGTCVPVRMPRRKSSTWEGCPQNLRGPRFQSKPCGRLRHGPGTYIRHKN